MTEFDQIIAHERAKTYKQRELEVFTYYTLILIADASATRRLKRRLGLTFVGLALILLVLLPLLEGVFGAVAAYWAGVGVYEIGTLALLSYALAGLSVFVLSRRWI